MLTRQLLIGSLMILGSVVFHATMLLFLASVLKLTRRRLRLRQGLISLIMLIMAVLGIIGIHTVEVWTWAGLYLYIGEFNTLISALYFSATTATTLGYGDIVLGEQWQVLSTFEAMGGLILFGLSAAFLFELVRGIVTHR